jgi:hypothetical protein
MYRGIKSKISMNGMSSDFFCCNVLSSSRWKFISLFIFYSYQWFVLSKEFLTEKNVLQMYLFFHLNELFLYLKLSVLFYTDDTVIMAETADDLQKALDEIRWICSRWKLKVNVEKTKVLVFSKSLKPKNI